MKLLTKLTLFSTVSKLLIVVLFVLLLPILMQQIAFRNTNKALEEQRAKVLKEVKQKGFDYYFQGQDEYGSYTMLKDEFISLEPTDTAYKNIHLETAIRTFDDGDTINYRILTHTFVAAGKNYLLEIGKKISTIEEEGRVLQTTSLYVLSLLILITFLSTYFYTRYILSPLNEIIKTKLLGRKFPFKQQLAPVKTRTYDFKYLDESISELMDHVHSAFEKEREFTSNASHELMTPISIMQSKIENMSTADDISNAQYLKLEELNKTLNRLKKIVNSLLLISRIENEQYIRNDIVQPQVLLMEVTDELTHRLEDKNLKLSIQLTEGVLLNNLNRDLLFQLFYNLLNNAIRYNKQGGNIIISDEYIAGNKYSVIIKNTGIGISQQQLPDIFNRFKKSNQSTEGYGLGLSIVKSIIQYENIDIKVDSIQNEGSTFTVIFNRNHLHP